MLKRNQPIPDQFGKKLFDEKKLEKQRATTEMKKPKRPGKCFRMEDLKMKDVDMFVKKARARVTPRNS